MFSHLTFFDPAPEKRRTALTHSRKKILFRLICLLLPFLVLEGIMYIKLWRSGKELIPYEILSAQDIKAFEAWLQQSDAYFQYDAELGWDVHPNGKKEKKKEQQIQYLYQANSQGIRSNREYTQSPSKNISRLVVLGDSFTHGDEVNLEETWAYLLEQQFFKKNVEVLNLGVPGYGTDQAVLKFEKKGLAFHPQIAILGVMTENICRNVNRFRPYYTGGQTGIPLTKPRFLIEKEQLVLAQPVTIPPRQIIQGLKAGQFHFLHEHDFFYHPGHYEDHWYYRSLFVRYFFHNMIRHQWKKTRKLSVLYDTPEPFLLLTKILERFEKLCRQNQIVPVFLVLYSRSDFEDKDPYWKPLLQNLKEKQYLFLDPYDILQKNEAFSKNLDPFFAENGHYSQKGNALIAQILADFLKTQSETYTFFSEER